MDRIPDDVVLAGRTTALLSRILDMIDGERDTIDPSMMLYCLGGYLNVLLDDQLKRADGYRGALWVAAREAGRVIGVRGMELSRAIRERFAKREPSTVDLTQALRERFGERVVKRDVDDTKSVVKETPVQKKGHKIRRKKARRVSLSLQEATELVARLLCSIGVEHTRREAFDLVSAMIETLGAQQTEKLLRAVRKRLDAVAGELSEEERAQWDAALRGQLNEMLDATFRSMREMRGETQ